MNKVIACILVLIDLTWSYKCNPDLDCITYGMGSKVPDVTDCNKYYICLSGGVPSPVSYDCGLGMFFDESIGDCSSSQLTSCSYPECSDSTTYCGLDCIANEYVPVPGEGSMYYVCNSGPTYIPETCATNLVFNGESCTPDQSAQCETCIVRCDILLGSYTIINPFNCNEYISCDNGVPGDTYSCGDGMYYDNLNGICEMGSCTSFCPQQ